MLRIEVSDHIRPVSESEARAVVEAGAQVYQWVSTETAVQTAMEDLRRRRVARRRTEYMAELRAKYHYQMRMPPPRLRRSLVNASGPKIGKADALVSIIEFSDFQCPFCASMSATLDRILREYADDVRLTFKHYPLPMHPQAAKAAEAALCAGEQGRFWELQRVLFAERDAVSLEQFGRLADRVGLEGAAFRECLDSHRNEHAWQADKAEGLAAGVSSTPTIFINDRMISGARTYQALKDIVEAEIRTERGRRGGASR